MLDESRFTISKGTYRFGRAGVVSDKTLLDVATRYENDVVRKFVGIQADQLSKRFPGEELVLSTLKYDGEGLFVYFSKESAPIALNAPSGGARIGFPALEALGVHLKAQGVQKCLLRAELYLPTLPGQARTRSADVNRLSHQGSEQELAALKLAVFDVIMLDGKDLRPNQENFQETWALLEKLVGSDASKPFHRPVGAIVASSKLPEVFTETVKQGGEGLVIRRLQRLEITKVKPDLTIDAAVIGYVEGEFEGKYGVTSLLTALTFPITGKNAITFQTLVRAGSGLSDEQRVQLLEVLSPLRKEAPLPMNDSDGRTIHFVKPELVVELRGEDLNPANREREHRTQVFEWNGEGYVFKGLAPCPRLTFATFRQVRADKTIESGGARITQLGIESAVPEIRTTKEQPPTIVRREVFVKGDAVRKLIIAEQAGEEVVPYLVYWVDYSAKRKDPLKVTPHAAMTRARADRLAEVLLAEGVTKGFLRHGEEAPLKAAEEVAETAPKKRASKKKEPKE